MSNVTIRTAFESRLATWAAAQTPALPIAYENRAFTPPANNRYLRAYLIPAPTVNEFLEGTHRSYEGVFQVSIVQPLTAGTASAATIALALDTLYQVSFLEGAMRVFITSPMSIAPAIIEPNNYVLPVSCFYRVDL
jgi:Bacteriophage related domain of unknown function